MVRTNLQEFVGDVHVLSNLQVGSNLFANDLAANVLTVDGSIGSTFFIGDGGLLSNIATTLNEIVANPGGNTVSNTLVFESGADATSNTAIATLSNVGISISNTEPTGEFQFAVGSNIFVNTHASNVLTVVGAIGSDLFIGDGGLLSNIATTLDQIVDQGNTVSNTIQLISGADVTSNTGLVTHKDVGISVSNTEPTGEFQFGVGSNLLVNVYSSNVLAIEGNVNAQKMTLGTITVTSAYGLNHVTAQGSVTGDTISLTNATTGLTADSNIVVGGNVTAETVITSANVEVGDRLKFASNVFVDDLRVADVAANLVTYDKTTGELMDSGGLFANKLAVVSVQPPSALSANTTTIAKHGTYTVTTSSLAANSNAWNAFDGDSAVEWLGSTTSDHVYNGGGYTYSGTSNLFAGNYIQPSVSSAGEWLAVEFPYRTTLRHMKLTPPTTIQQYPASANVYATNDSLTWTELTNWSGVDPGSASNVQTIIVNATESFKKYALVVTKTNESDTNTALAEWKLFTESFSIDGGKVEMATSAVMGGETTVEQSGPHSRLPKATPLRKYPEIVFEEGKFDANDSTNTYVQAGYMVSSNGYYDNGPTDLRQPWRAFNNVLLGGSSSTDIWLTPPGSFDNTNSPSLAVNGDSFTVDSTTYTGHWIKLELPTKIKASKIRIYSRGSDQTKRRPYKGVFLGSNTGNTNDWSVIKSFDGDLSWTTVGIDTANREIVIADLNSTTNSYFKYVMFVIQSTVGTGQFCWINELEYYGYEELATQGDTSVDTTFTSIMNTPQTTGANVYVDGNLGETFTNRVTGPTPTGTATTYNSTDKYWELTGALTSNISVEANTFLEGDAPHSVSVWFNSSNLEANTANTCVFSISDQEKLDSVNLDLQSNTWHNLTYAYQGEGGSRVTYLDGRKVAEDQAEDTFGEYPPFAMTGYSQGGYVVSASGEYSSTYQQWEPYGEGGTDAPNSWISGPTQNYFGTGTGATGEAYTSGANVADTTVIDGVTTYGEWNQVEFPEKLHLSSVALNGINTIDTARYPRDAIVCASIDGITWTSIGSWTGEVNRAEADIKHYILNSTKAFKYVRIVVTKISTGYDGLTMLSRVRYYGHRENDLVRLPDPTNVLKYPHIAMTGPAQRGYVVSASSNYNNLDRYAGWNAFNETVDDPDGWVSYPGSYSSGTPSTYSGVSQPDKLTGIDATSSGGDTSRNGSWLKIEVPHKLKLSQMKLFRRRSGERIVEGFIYGSNDNSTFYQISNNLSQITNIGTYSNTTPLVINSTDTTTPFKQFVVQVTQNDTTTYTNVGNLELYGTGVDSIPIQIGGGNIDKVANFRVYDKFVGEDQALEIWDAQKDEFGRAKSSMTLHKGRLGIGTTEPQGRLAVLDEPHNLEEFPPRAMTGYKTYFEGHGEFRARESSISGANTTGFGWKAFDRQHDGTTTTNGREWRNSAGFENTTGIYTGSEHHHNGGVLGAWLEIELPYKIKLQSHKIHTGYAGPSTTDDKKTKGRYPKTFNIYGYTDNYWELISEYTSVEPINVDEEQTFISSKNEFYNKFVIIVKSTYAGSGGSFNISTAVTSIGMWRLFGTREQGQSVLHDGQLTLTKSLNVPRIGPALDADDTPRRDRLVVEYNTSTNPTFEGAVRDTSGRGLDGVFVGGASYDATEKALKFTASSNQYVNTNIPLPADGNFIHSMSMWFNPTSLTASPGDAIVFIGDNTDNNKIEIFMETDRINYLFGGNNYEATLSLTNGRWYHLAVTYNGNVGASGREIYIDGVQRSASHSGLSELLNLTNGNLDLGRYTPSGSSSDYAFDGSISNFKLYDTALTAEEVKTLYDMGRCDEGHHVVNFSKTRVGIGLGDGEAPQGPLDVSGGMSRGLFTINQTEGQWYNGTALRFFQYNSSDRWDIGIVSGTDDNFAFSYNGFSRGYFDDAGTNVLQNFTGQHRTFIKDVPFSQAGDLEGLIVSSDQNKYIKMSGGIEAGSNAITTNESLPVVSLSNVVTDKKCFGVISASEDPEERSDSFGNFVSVAEKEKGDTRVYINSVGEGAIWVVNTNGSLEAGDYITTSNVAGYGQKQDDDVLHNYTVAKITMDCDFEPATQPVQQILRSNVVETYYLGNVHKVKNVPHEFVTTVVGADDAWSNVSVSPSDVTYAEWSNLEANTQNTYTLTYTQTSNVVYDTKYTLTTTANVTESDAWDRVFVDPPTVTYAEYSNLEANTQNTYTLTYTQTTTDEKTPDQWSTLESNVQSLYNKVYYQSVEEEVAKDYPGAVAHTRVTDVIENELDEHGQIQWEDHPTETEKAYKIRYLDASGAQTDSANAVHIAAFVGCTYHCG
jgi:hypothetical protein